MKLMRTKVNESFFKEQPFYVGIDCHKKNWSVAIYGEEFEHKVMSQDPDPVILAKYLKEHFPGGIYHAVYEAGFSGFGACRKLNELGIKCNVVHPADVPTSHKEKVQKNDRADSRKLARSLRNRDFEAIHVPDPKLEADRALVRQRSRVMKDLCRTKNRVKSLLYQFGLPIPSRFTLSQTRHWSKGFTEWLKELPLEEGSLKKTLDNYIRTGGLQRNELLLVTRQVRALSQEEAYKRNCQLMVSIPGVAITTAMAFLVQIGDIKRFGRLDDLCNYIGLVPGMHSSGDKVRAGKITNRGRKDLKVLLIEASWDVIRIDPALMAKYNELKKRMPGNKAIIRIARKMLSRIRFVLQNQQPYELSVVK